MSRSLIGPNKSHPEKNAAQKIIHSFSRPSAAVANGDWILVVFFSAIRYQTSLKSFHQASLISIDARNLTMYPMYKSKSIHHWKIMTLVRSDRIRQADWKIVLRGIIYLQHFLHHCVSMEWIIFTEPVKCLACVRFEYRFTVITLKLKFKWYCFKSSYIWAFLTFLMQGVRLQLEVQVVLRFKT